MNAVGSDLPRNLTDNSLLAEEEVDDSYLFCEEAPLTVFGCSNAAKEVSYLENEHIDLKRLFCGARA